MNKYSVTQKDNAPPHTSNTAKEFVLFVLGAAVLVTAASSLARVSQSGEK